MNSSTPTRPMGWRAEVMARGAREVGEALGLASRDHPASLSPCPACGQETRHRKSGDHRAAVNLTSNGAGWYCLQCGARGDAAKLVGWCVLGRAPRTVEDWRAVRGACASRGLCAAAPGSAAPTVTRRPLPAPLAPPVREHLPTGEAEAFWEACRPLADDPAALAYLLTRYGPHGYTTRDLATLHDVVRASPLDGFPEWWPEKWSATYRAVVPAYTGRGVLAGFQARETTDRTKLKGFAACAVPGPKVRWPLKLDRYSFHGLVFADRLGRSVLSGRAASGLRRVLVVEGLTDTIRAALYARRAAGLTAVLGVESGAASAFRELGRRWPKLPGGAPVPCVVATDPDAQGALYLSAVRDALPASVPVLEVKL